MQHFSLPTDFHEIQQELPYAIFKPPKKLVIERSGLDAGAGKSLSIFEKAKSGEKTIIATPTDALSEQYFKFYREAGIPATIVSNKHNPNRSSAHHFKERVKAGDRLILVHNKIVHATDADLSGYHVIEDEIEEPLIISTFKNAQYMRELFAQFIRVEEITDHSDYYKLQLTPAAIDIANKGWNYAGVADILPLCKFIYSHHHENWVLASSWNGYQAGDQHNIAFWTIRQPSHYANAGRVSLIGANAEHLLISRLWADKVEFRQPDWVRPIYPNLHHLKDRARVLYVSRAPLTGALFKEIGRQTIVDALADWMAENMPNEPHIFGTNPNKGVNWPFAGGTGEDVKLIAHGLNSFQDRHCAIYMAAQYYDPATYKFLKEVFDIEPEDVTRAFTFERSYQFLMRISARNMNTDQPFTMIVPDEDIANFLWRLFGFTSADARRPEFIDLGIEELGAERKQLLTDEQKRAHKTAQQTARREAKKALANSHDNTIQYDGFLINVWSEKDAKVVNQTCSSWSDLVSIFRVWHTTYDAPSAKYKAKSFREGFLKDISNHHTKDNIQSVKILALDCDKCTGDIQKLSQFLTGLGLSHLIYNSASSTVYEPRFRLLIGLNEAVNRENYRHIIKLVEADIEAKFGKGAFVFEQEFYHITKRGDVPSISKFKAALFIESTVRRLDLDYDFSPKFLDVRRYLERKPVPLENKKKERKQPKAKSSTSKRSLDEIGSVDRIIEKWAIAPKSGKGREHFKWACIDLKAIGLTREQNLQVLTANKHRFGTGENRDPLDMVDYVYDPNWRNRT